MRRYMHRQRQKMTTTKSIQRKSSNQGLEKVKERLKQTDAQKNKTQKREILHLL